MDPIPHNPPVLKSFFEIMRRLFETTGGAGGNLSKRLRGWMEEAGLKRVEEKVGYAAHGEAIDGKDLKQKSIDSPCSAVAPILMVVRSMPPSFQDGDLEDLEPRLRRGLEEKGGHSCIRVVWGRK
ncbi:hypothetical protein B0A55_07593 [Friedmanniomyces simplex]|uniref:Uncharacterized protein n=1 Tax=Friedmanniomyces simplex TaxID=329884 RepID=A0A4U0X5W2_9PEZI|nr:hypothetical protein B0A55_07593 [Friedmanniomyces simplex]